MPYFQNSYKFDSDLKAYIIAVSLGSYDDVYDDWDPSPFKKRDIEDEFSDFITDSALDIPLRYNIAIKLHLPESIRNDKKEVLLKKAYTNHFRFLLGRLYRHKKKLREKLMAYSSLALLFLLLAYSRPIWTEHLALEIIREGVFVGGWVFLWEVFTLLFITFCEEKIHENHLNRLLHARIEFLYK
jgi:hypothetical protein